LSAQDGKGYPITDPYTITGTGEVAGAATATVLPTLTCKWVKFFGVSDNAAAVYIGITSGVTKPNGSTDTTTGIPVAAGGETDWLPAPNLNLNGFYQIGAVGDDLVYIALA
jgi:hypothetical protein